MKIFIDLGTYNGDVMKKAYKRFKDFDLFVGFEPMPDLYEQTNKRFASTDKIQMKKCAAGVSNEKDVKLYVNWTSKSRAPIGKGSTLFSNKTSGSIDKNKYVLVDVIDFAEYLSSNFKSDDYIILKIDIEGKEYDLLEHLMETGTISFIDELYCEWHYHKITDENIHKTRHQRVIRDLNKLGFKLTGDNKKDEYSKRF